MIIRQATADDFEAVYDLQKQLINFHIENRRDIMKAPPKMNKRQFKKGLKKNSFYVTVLEADNKIAGFCKWQLSVCKNNDTFSDRTFAFITDIFICEEYRHSGNGKQLFNKVIEQAKEKGATAIELNVWDFNENAKGFYEHLGLTPQRTIMEKNI